jgi:hypothetical protein
MMGTAARPARTGDRSAARTTRRSSVRPLPGDSHHDGHHQARWPLTPATMTRPMAVTLAATAATRLPTGFVADLCHLAAGLPTSAAALHELE